MSGDVSWRTSTSYMVPDVNVGLALEQVSKLLNNGVITQHLDCPLWAK